MGEATLGETGFTPDDTVLGQPRPEIAQGAAADIEEIHILYEAAVRNNVEIVPVEQDDQRRHIFAGFQSAQV